MATYAGFDSADISNYLGIQKDQATALINYQQAGGNVDSMSQGDLIALSQIPQTTARWENITWGLQHLMEHPKGSHYGGSFNPFTALQRFFTINPQSFTPGNIARSVGAGMVAFYTGGASLAKPSIQGVTLASSDTNKAGLVDSAYVGGLSYGQTRAGDPNVKETLFNSIARFFGGAVSSFATGRIATSWITPVGAPLSPGAAGPTQPFSSAVSNYALSGVSASASGFFMSNVSKVVLGLFGQKVGGAFLSLLSGNVAQAVQILSTDTPNQAVNLFGPNGGGGGSGGAGFLPSQNTGQSNALGVIIPIMGIGAVILIVWYFFRKKA